ncbi:hypothetical protein R0135_04885 [Congregibacter variabilis]|uniref:DUF4345 domain-containing protein n=1 Tax=Congregibacter variabilis TaxID=3081200 RepID=A0ABZ0I7Q4_9GAMM|nr:hypothetical protein R0135_04885 [Congregibacter sp. IMCC43200]
MNKILRLLVALPGVLFVVTGLRWLVDPSAAATQFAMPLLDGLGRSSQIGDLSGFFLTLGMVILIALITGKRVWYYPAIMLLGFTLLGRILAWLVHDATLAIEMIAVEFVVACLLLFASRKLAERG